VTNKNQERITPLQLKVPTGAIATGALLIFGTTKPMVGVAATGQAASPPANYDDNSGYVTVDFEGVFNLSVIARTQKSPSAGAAISIGDAIYADGGTYDPATGITTGSVLDADTNGAFVGLALDAVAAGVTATIRVVLKGCPQ
jgi:hypothetical protein